MTVEQILALPFIKDDTHIFIRTEVFELRACLTRLHPQILRWYPYDVKVFSWDEDNQVCITIYTGVEL
ncbi:MAG: hypothetical protein LUK37_01795 [Clostridia bacterium]|nr:hypothetical protein [Clostridia bacterium]